MANREILDSWKEIAAYLGRSVKTCRRWEHELGLPVHRLEESPKARVFAYPDELDQWVKKTQKSEADQKRHLPRKANFFILVMVGTLAISAIIFWKLIVQKREEPLLSNEPSIAILPFDDLSPQKNQGHICEGLAETLITALSQIKNLYVPARSSAFSIKEKTMNYQEIGEKLNVDAVLEGSIQKAGNFLRITTRITNTQDGSSLWSETYTGEEKDILDIQDKISMEIFNNLKIELLGEEKARLVKQNTKNPDAYHLYWKGRYFLNRIHIEDMEKAFECFQEALEKDPFFARAHVGLAHCYYLLGEHRNHRPKEFFPRVKAALEKALEIEDSLADTHAFLGRIKLIFDWDLPAAENEIKAALELNPNSATAHAEYSRYLRLIGKYDEAIEEAERAKDLDPLSLYTSYALGGVLKRARQYNRAIREFQRVLEMDPNYHLARFQLIKTYRESGRYDEASSEFKNLREISGWDQFRVELAQIYALSENKIEAENILEHLVELSKKRYTSPCGIARIYAALNQNDHALDWLERAYEERDPGLIKLKTDPIYDGLRSDPRLKTLLVKIGFEK